MGKKRQEKIMVGLSGGVDSSVAALLLRDAGFDVVAGFMKNWSDTPDVLTGECGWKSERRDAMRVAAHLGISFVTFDFEKEYRDRILAYMIAEYSSGRTPNPDVLCNREVKFDCFLKAAVAAGCDAVATGHYARISYNTKGDPCLLAGIDGNKDQSYFLHQLTREQLVHARFPVGHLEKSEVRRLAHKAGLPTAEKKDSQGLCFVGKVDLKTFLGEHIKGKKGPIISTSGDVVGVHEGLAPYTIGQRHGFGGGGGEPCFVVEKDIFRNTLVIACGRNPKELYSRALRLESMHWITNKPGRLPFRCRVRIRYRQPLQDAEIQESTDGKIEIFFSSPQRAVSPGQFAVFYDGEMCIGGGVIDRALTI